MEGPESMGTSIEMIAGIEKWKVEDDLRAFQSVHEVKDNQKRLRAVRKLAKTKIDCLEAVVSSATVGSGGFRSMDAA